MNFVSQVERCRTDGQIEYVALGREYEHFIVKYVNFDGIHKLFCAVYILLSVHNLAKPAHFAVEFAILARRALFILPMRRNAVFCDSMHFVRADLYLESFVERRNDGRVQRLIVVCLGHCNIVFESTGERFPHGVDFTEHRIAVLDGIHYDTHCQKVVNLVYIDVKIVHLLVHGVEVFGSAVHLAVYAHFFEFCLDLLADSIQKALSFTAFFVDVLGNVFVLCGIEVFHCQVFQFALEERDTQPTRKRCVYIESLFCNTLLLFFGQILKGAHIVKSVGKFDDDNAQVLCHCDENLAEVLRLRLFPVYKLKFVEFGNALDELDDFVTEFVTELVVGHGSIFQNVVQKRGYDR